MRHSRYCNREWRPSEAICECGHPYCLHREYAPVFGNPTGRIGSCRSKECSPAINEECDSFSDAREEA